MSMTWFSAINLLDLKKNHHSRECLGPPTHNTCCYDAND